MSRYEVEQRLLEVQAQQQALAVEAARLKKFLRQLDETEKSG